MFAHVQLLNPGGSGKRVRLRSAHVIASVGVGVSLRRFDTPLTTLGLPAGFIVENLNSAIPPGSEVAEMRSESNVAALGTTIWQGSAPPNQPAIYPPEGREWGFDLRPGQAILFQAAAAVTLIVMWQWIEVPE